MGATWHEVTRRVGASARARQDLEHDHTGFRHAQFMVASAAKIADLTPPPRNVDSRFFLPSMDAKPLPQRAKRFC